MTKTAAPVEWTQYADEHPPVTPQPNRGQYRTDATADTVFDCFACARRGAREAGATIATVTARTPQSRRTAKWTVKP